MASRNSCLEEPEPPWKTRATGLSSLRPSFSWTYCWCLREELGAELDVAGLVDTVDVAEAGGDGEVGGDGVEGLVDVVDVLGLGVEGVVVDGLVVDTVLLTTGDTDLHLDPLLHGSSALEVGGGGLDVVVNLLLGKVNHVGGEEGLAVGLEVGLVGVHHAIVPGEELLGAVVGVEDNGDVVGGGDGTDVVGGGNGTGDGGLLVLVGHTLTGEVGSTAVGELEDDGRLGVTGGLERGDDGGRAGHVDGGDGELLLLGVLEESADIVADDDTGLAGEDGLGHCDVLGVALIVWGCLVRWMKLERIGEGERGRV